MAVTTSYPGVYVVENTSPAISVSQVSTAVPVFIGQFRNADGTTLPEGQCIKINEWTDFSGEYSGIASIGFVITSEEQSGSYKYNENVWGGPSGVIASVQHYFVNGGGPCYLLPITDPADPVEMAGLAPAIQKCSDITLLISVYSSTSERDQVYGSLNGLLVDGNNYFLLADTQDPLLTPATKPELTAVYYPNVLLPGQPQSRPADSAIALTGYVDAAANNVKTMADLKVANPALYEEISSEVDQYMVLWSVEPINAPATAGMAGIYCATDRSRGVWKAPANTVMAGTLGISTRVSDSDQGIMNNEGINVIRYFIDRGVVPWGARTLAGTLTNSDTRWRYIPVRRLFNSAEADIKRAMQQLVFEPNNQPTWLKARHAIDNYLHGLWRMGGLAGATPQDAYWVEIGEGITMTADDIAQGKMIARVGMAAARPAEFIVLEFTQRINL